MRDDRFEWDDAKAAANLDKHKVSFEMARLVFSDVNGVDKDDPDPDETRFMRVGMARERLLSVIYTERGERIRIISARKASRHEETEYNDKV